MAAAPVYPDMFSGVPSLLVMKKVTAKSAPLSISMLTGIAAIGALF